MFWVRKRATPGWNLRHYKLDCRRYEPDCYGRPGVQWNWSELVCLKIDYQERSYTLYYHVPECCTLVIHGVLSEDVARCYIVLRGYKPTVRIQDDLSKIDIPPDVRHSDHQVTSHDWLCTFQHHDRVRGARVLVTNFQVWDHWSLVWVIRKIRWMCHC